MWFSGNTSTKRKRTGSQADKHMPCLTTNNNKNWNFPCKKRHKGQQPLTEPANAQLWRLRTQTTTAAVCSVPQTYTNRNFPVTNHKRAWRTQVLSTQDISQLWLFRWKMLAAWLMQISLQKTFSYKPMLCNRIFQLRSVIAGRRTHQA